MAAAITSLGGPARLFKAARGPEVEVWSSRALQTPNISARMLEYKDDPATLACVAPDLAKSKVDMNRQKVNQAVSDQHEDVSTCRVGPTVANDRY